MRFLVSFLFVIIFDAFSIAGEHNNGDAKNPRETGKIILLQDGLIFDGVRISGDDGTLRGFNAAENKQIWVTRISYFWNRIRLVEKDIASEKKWLLELLPCENTDRGAEKREYRDLRTGNEVVIPSAPPAGEQLGSAQVIPVKTSLGRYFVALISTQQNFEVFWARAHGPMDAGKASLDGDLLEPGINISDGKRREIPPLPPVDFTKNVILVFNVGDCFNSRGKNQQGIWVNEERVLMRFSTSGYQSFGGAHLRRVCAAFILPRYENRRYEIELNTQNIIGGPAIWEKIEIFPQPKGDAAETAEFAPEFRPGGEKLPPGFERVIQHAVPKNDELHLRFFGKQAYDYYMLNGKAVMHGPYKQEKKFDKGWLSVKEGNWIDGIQEGAWLYRSTLPHAGNRIPKEAEQIRVTYDRGVRHGTFEVTDATGLKAVAGAYENGFANGIWTVTHDDGTKSIYPFVRGLYHGDLQRISAAGDITWKEHYEMGKKKE